MEKKIVVEWTLEDVASMAHEWTGVILTKAQAEKVLNRVKKTALDEIRSAGTSVIFKHLEDAVR